MAKFIHSSRPGLEGTAESNDPVNIELVIQVVKSTSIIFPEKVPVPSILFRFVGWAVAWRYKDDESARDRDYVDIVNNKF